MPPGVSFLITIGSMQNGAVSSHSCAFFPVVSSVSLSLVGDLRMSSGVSGYFLASEFVLGDILSLKVGSFFLALITSVLDSSLFGIGKVICNLFVIKFKPIAAQQCTGVNVKAS